MIARNRILPTPGWAGPARLGGAISVLLIMVFLMGCQPTIAPTRPAALDKATSLKVEALDLMGKATEPYAQHRAAAETLRLNLEKAYEDAKAIPNNEISAQMWEVLKNPNGNLLGGFLSLWKKQSVLSQAYISDKKLQVGEAFDKIINLEVNKPKS